MTQRSVPAVVARTTMLLLQADIVPGHNNGSCEWNPGWVHCSSLSAAFRCTCWTKSRCEAAAVSVPLTVAPPPHSSHSSPGFTCKLGQGDVTHPEGQGDGVQGCFSRTGLAELDGLKQPNYKSSSQLRDQENVGRSKRSGWIMWWPVLSPMNQQSVHKHEWLFQNQ